MVKEADKNTTMSIKCATCINVGTYTSSPHELVAGGWHIEYQTDRNDRTQRVAVCRDCSTAGGD